ncbi:MAG: serine/threonine-protein kinase, partial [Pseudomonadales bacterium]
MSERRSNAADKSELSSDKTGQAENKTVRDESDEKSQRDETAIRKPAARNENATILREPGGFDDPTSVSEPAGARDTDGSQADEATVARDGPRRKASDRQPEEPGRDQPDSGDQTVLKPGIDDDSTVLGGRASGDADTTYVASQGPESGARGNAEAGRLLKNRFVLEEKVGSGGMGDVYKALDLRAQEAQERNPYIAIKILNENFARHRDAFISLQREASKTRGIPHNNIMGVYDFDREGDTVFMSMELLDGEPLDDYLKKHPEGVSREDAWNIIDGICQGLMRAHGAGIVHSDFKPGNIYWTGDKTAKVFDFGIARAVSSPGDLAADGEKTVFDAGALGALTPTYASYEMLKGKEPSTSDDVYALALVAYEVFTGRHPYNRTPADKALEQGLEPEPIPWMKRRHWRALKRGLAIKGDNRTATVEEFYQGLFSEDPPVIRYSVLGLVLVASISFGVYSYFNETTTPERLNDLRGSASSNRDALRNRLENRDEWNFSSPEWRQIIDESLNKVKLASIEMQEEFDQQPLAYIEDLETKVMDSYLIKIRS